MQGDSSENQIFAKACVGNMHYGLRSPSKLSLSFDFYASHKTNALTNLSQAHTAIETLQGRVDALVASLTQAWRRRWVMKGPVRPATSNDRSFPDNATRQSLCYHCVSGAGT